MSLGEQISTKKIAKSIHTDFPYIDYTIWELTNGYYLVMKKSGGYERPVSKTGIVETIEKAEALISIDNPLYEVAK
jgi:hypothetical protein